MAAQSLIKDITNIVISQEHESLTNEYAKLHEGLMYNMTIDYDMILDIRKQNNVLLKMLELTLNDIIPSQSHILKIKQMCTEIEKM